MSICRIYSDADLLNFLKFDDDIYVYGAGDISHVFVGYFCTNYSELSVNRILVKETVHNPKQVQGILVMQLYQIKKLSKDVKIVVAVGEKLHQEILEILLENGFTNIAFLSSEYEVYLKKMDCFKKMKEEIEKLGNMYSVEFWDRGDHHSNLRIYDKNSKKGLYWKYHLCFQESERKLLGNTIGRNLYEKYCEYVKISSSLEVEVKDISYQLDVKEDLKKNLQMFIVVNVADKQLLDIDDTEIEKSWVHLIQTGSANTKKRLAQIIDCDGDNISNLNPYFSEVTALYWIWKNANKSKYVGLCHYRRRFDLTDELLGKLMLSDIDVVLVFPEIEVPNTRTVFVQNYLKESDWEIVLDIIKEKEPEYYETAVKHGNSIFLYPCNMFIARWEIFCEYAEWLFNITLEVYQYCEQNDIRHDDMKDKRFLGYIAENLLTVFFVKNAGRYKIACCDKR